MQYTGSVSRTFAIAAALLLTSFAPPLIDTARAQESDSSDAQSPDVAVQTGSGVTWSLNARLRPRFEGRWNHQFGLEPDALNYANPDQTDLFTNQTRVGAEVDADTVSADILLQHAGAMGTTGGNQLSHPRLDVHHASFTWAPVDAWSLQAGRFPLAYGGERVLGAVGWSQVGRTWDGLRTEIAPLDGLEIDLFGARYAEGSSVALEGYEGGFLEDDAFLTGMYASASESLLGALDAAELYTLYDIRLDRPDDPGPMRRGLATFGARVAGTWAPIDAELESAYQTGQRCVEGSEAGNCTDETVATHGWFVDAVVGATFGESPTARVFAAYARASGDDPDTDVDEGFDQLYPTGHKWLGFTDIIGPRTNIQDARGGFSLTIGDVTVDETVHHFTRLEPSTEPVGWEFDTTVGVGFGDHFTLNAGHGLFVPGDGMSATDASPSGVANWGFLQFVASL